jgi:DNA polymerase (family 10)
MGQDSVRMTSRLKRAMNHKSVTMIGHLSTRIIGHRSPIDFNMEEILLTAKSSGTALELNSSPERLDLKDTHACLAKDFGIPLVLNTDSHNVHGFNNRRYGIAVARRAWCEPKHVLNTLPLSKFIDYISAPKPDRNDMFLANWPSGC